MSQSAKSEIAIYLNKDVEVPLALSSKTALHQKLLQFYKDSHHDFVGEPDISITKFDIYDDSIELELYSTRKINLDFQVDLLAEYLENYHADIIDEVTFDKWLQVD